MNEKKKDREYKDKEYGGVRDKNSAIVPPLKDYSSRTEWEKAIWYRILESKEVLPLLVTSRERHDLVMRMAIMEGLAFGKGHRQLSRELFVSLQTINSVKKSMVENSYKSYSERAKTDRKKRKYSHIGESGRQRKNRGRIIRTKYGILHMPH